MFLQLFDKLTIAMGDSSLYMKSLYKLVITGACLILAFLGASAAPVVSPASPAALLNESPEVWGEAAAGLEMSVRTIRSEWSSGDDPVFQVRIRNTGDKDVFLNLGITLANGRRLFPEAVSLVLIDTEGISHELESFGSVINGRVDDYAVGLQIGAVHLLKLKLSQFLSKTLPGDKIHLKEGRYKVAARFEGHGAQHKNTGMDWVAWNFLGRHSEFKHCDFRCAKLALRSFYPNLHTTEIRH